MRTMSKLLALLALALPTFCAQAALAQARTFKVGAPSQLQFVSDAPLERITGISSGLRGEITVDPNNAAAGKAEIRIDTATLKTGLDLRDEHLRSEKWLDAGHFPTSTFVITKVSGIEKLKPNELAEPTVTGKFTMHGVTREITTKAKVRFTPAAANVTTDALRVQTSFTVHLEDYKVSIPSIVALKVSPDIQINVDMHATADAVAKPAPEAAQAPTPAVTEPSASVAPAAQEPAPAKGKGAKGKQTKPAASAPNKPKANATKKPAGPSAGGSPKKPAAPAKP